MPTRRLSISTAAFCLALLLPGAALAELKPFQKEALERILQTVEPEARAMARPQLEMQLGMMNQAQVAMMVAALEQGQAEAAAEQAAPEPRPVTAEDLAFNRAQYEPALRRLFDAQLAYDLLLTKLLGKGLAHEDYAVWGSAWRAELPPLTVKWPESYADFETFRMTYDGMAPQDGRYRFSMPDIASRFDEAAIKTAIAEAAQDYAALGKSFKAEARRLADAQKFDELYTFERRAGAQVEPIRARLEKLLKVHAPSPGAVIMALQQATPVE